MYAELANQRFVSAFFIPGIVNEKIIGMDAILRAVVAHILQLRIINAKPSAVFAIAEGKFHFNRAGRKAGLNENRVKPAVITRRPNTPDVHVVLGSGGLNNQRDIAEFEPHRNAPITVVWSWLWHNNLPLPD